MTTAPAATLSPLERQRSPITPAGWAAIGALGLLFVLVHGTFLERLFRIVTNAKGEGFFEVLASAATESWNADWSHALVVPFISLFCIYLRRDDLAVTPRRVCFWGLPILVTGLISYVFWVHPGRNDMMQGYSMIAGLFGLVLFVLGPAMMRHLWFPIAYLVFAVKISDRLWEAIAFKLQIVAANAATVALQFFTLVFNFEVDNRGSTIVLHFMENGLPVERALNVAEACSGLRSLMAFVALGVALAFLWDRAWWQRLIMIAMAVPIAIAVNVGRVTALGLLSLIDEKYTRGDFHTMIGMFMLVPAAFLFLLLGWILDRVIVREETDDDATGDAARGRNLPSHRDADAEPARPFTNGRAALPAGALAAATGALAALVAGGLYLAMLSVGAPRLDFLPGHYVTLAGNMLVKMALLAGPGALAATAVCVVGWFLLNSLRRRGAGTLIPAAAMAGALMLTVFIGQQVAVAKSGLVLIKLGVPLRHPLVLLPAEVNEWKLVREDPPLSPEVLETLGTEQYISRVYEDTTWPEREPGRYVRLHVAYYTGTTDTVPHVPDRCFIAGGVAGLDKGIAQLNLSGDYHADEIDGGYLHPVQLRRQGLTQPPARVPATEFDATYFTFGDPNGGQAHNVLYFFAANGKFLPTPDHVRFSGFEPTDKYSYYCKIEVQLMGMADSDAAAGRASAVLSDLLPEIMACLPDWVDVKAGRWPAESQAPAAEPSLTAR